MSWFDSKEKAALDAAIRAVAKPATALIVDAEMKEDHVFPATATHFGGNPYFEKGEAWPTLAGDGRPYDFLCQVNLRDCPDRPDVPFLLFTVFLCWKLYEEVDMDRFVIVRTYEKPNQARSITLARPPARDPDDYQVRPCVVRTERFMTYPDCMEEHPGPVEVASGFRNPRAAYEASLKRIGAWRDFRSRIGGYPTWVHAKTFEPEDYLLAQIDFERKAGNCIGDAAPIYLSANAAEPGRIGTDAFQSF